MNQVSHFQVSHSWTDTVRGTFYQGVGHISSVYIFEQKQHYKSRQADISTEHIQGDAFKLTTDVMGYHDRLFALDSIIHPHSLTSFKMFYQTEVSTNTCFVHENTYFLRLICLVLFVSLLHFWVLLLKNTYLVPDFFFPVSFFVSVSHSLKLLFHLFQPGCLFSPSSVLHQTQRFSTQSYHCTPALIAHPLIPLINSLTSSFQSPLSFPALPFSFVSIPPPLCTSPGLKGDLQLNVN